MKKEKEGIIADQGQDPFREKGCMIGIDQKGDTDQEVDLDHHTGDTDTDDEPCNHSQDDWYLTMRAT